MENIFAKPAPMGSPISQFVPLPLALINRIQEQKEQTAQRKESMASSMADMLFKTTSTAGDSTRHAELIGSAEAQIEELANSDLPLSELIPKYRQLKSRLLSAASGGELAAINRAGLMSQKSVADATKKYADGKISADELRMVRHKAATHKTTKDEFGNYSRFNPYEGSGVRDLYGDLAKIIDGVNDDSYKANKTFLTQEQITESVDATMQGNPAMMKAFNEKFMANYNTQGKSKEDVTRDFSNFKEFTIQNLIKQRQYNKLSEATNSTAEFIINGFQGETTGISEYAGGDIPMLRSIFGSTETFNKFKNSPEGKIEISNMEALSGNKMPSNYREAVKWFESYKSDIYKTDLSVQALPENEKLEIINKDGILVAENAVFTRGGKPVDASDIEDNIQGSKKNSDGVVSKAHVVGKIKSNDGTMTGYVIRGKDGNIYRIKSQIKKDINNDKDNHNKIISTVGPKVPTGKQNITLHAPMNVAGGYIPKGKYVVKTMRKDYYGKKNPKPYVILFQDGVPKYTHVLKEEVNGKPVYNEFKGSN